MEFSTPKKKFLPCIALACTQVRGFFLATSRLHEASIVRGEDASNAAVTAIPAQNRVTLQILNHWQPFRDLKLMFAVSRRAEKLRLRSQ